MIQIILIISMLTMGILPAYATGTVEPEPIIVKPMWSHVNQFNNSFSITPAGMADIESTLYAFEVDVIEIKVDLQQFKNGSWVTIKSWTETTDYVVCKLVGKWYVVKGYGYRMVATGRVYIGGQMVEEVSFSSRVIYYD